MHLFGAGGAERDQVLFLAGGLRAAGVEDSLRSVLHGPEGPQAQQEVVTGDQCQIHDLSRSREKPVSRVAVRQWQLLSGQHDRVGLDRAIRANRLLLGSHLFGIEAAEPSRFSQPLIGSQKNAALWNVFAPLQGRRQLKRGSGP